MKLIWWTVLISVLGIASSWIGSVPGITNLTLIFTGVLLLVIAIILWFVVLVRWLATRR